MGFMDLRHWIALLEQDGELRRIAAEVDRDREIGAIAAAGTALTLQE